MDRKVFPELPLHHIGLGLRLHGPLDRDRLEAALRHALGSSDCFDLRMDEAQPEQWFAPADELHLDFVDLAGSRDDERRWRGQLTCRRFELGGPLVRTGLARVGPHEHLLLLVFHHVVADGGTAMLLANRLAAAYAGRPSATPPSYRVYLEQHKSYRASPRFADDAAYWSAKLAAGTTPLELYGRPHRDPSLLVVQVAMPDAPARLAGMAALARDPRVTLVSTALSQLIAHTTLLAAYTHRATGNREIVVAVPFANRPGVLAQVAGLTMEQLLLKLEIDDDESFASLAQKVRREVASAMRHGRYCVSERGISFVTLNLLAGRLDPFGDLAVEFDPCESFLYEEQVAGLHSPPRNLLSVNIYETGGPSNRFELRFHAATFPGEARVRARNHYLRLMDAMLASLDTPIATLPLLDDAERRTLLGFCQGAQPTEVAPDLSSRFAHWVDRQPTATAVATATGDCGYAELHRRVRHLAGALHTRGVGPETAVCVCLPRSLDDLVALLAVLEVGGAYVPVDPSHPAERNQLVVEDAGPQVAVTLGALAPLFAGIPTIPLDRYDWASQPAPAPPPPAADPAQLAYVLFTSGSTGRPKGVEVTRGNLANFLASMVHTPGLTAADRVLAITTTTFDIAVLELFLPLYCGATVEIVDRATAADPRLLRRVLERQQDRITLLQGTPATWRMLLDAGFVPDRSLRLLCGGEALSSTLARQLTANGGELWNMYGPTETTVWSSLARVPKDPPSICIGKPIDRTNIYVMGPGLEPQPIGTIGEICIGGAGVARGYRGRPDLTVQRFLPDPILGGDNRLYRTGDLGRWQADGCLECLGRLDHQVKVRGFRIELGEIEACLRPVPGLADVLVVARPAPSGESSLVAYWTGDEVDEAPLAARVRTLLPSYMHPAAFVHLAKFPLNTNGKVDRKLLPDPASCQRPAASLKPPASPTEQRLQGIWEDLLGRSPIGVDQSFFDVGGDSILVVTLVARIAEAFGVEVPLSRVLEAPTIESLAQSLSVATVGAPSSPTNALVALRPGHAECVFFVHDGDGETLPYRNLALLLPPGVAVYGIVPRPERGLRMPHATLVGLARHYVAEMRRRQPAGPYRLVGLCAGGVIAFEMARQLEGSGERASLLVLIDAAATDARPRFALQTQDRFHRVREIMRATQAAQADGMWRMAHEIARRARNLLDYELRGFAHRAAVGLRHRLLQRSAREGRVWPRWVSPPSIRETCLQMQRHHDTGVLRNATVLLVRANGGDGSDADRPLRERYEDPLLGWGSHVGQGLEVLDLPAGHASLLQGDSLKTLAARLAKLLS